MGSSGGECPSFRVPGAAAGQHRTADRAAPLDVSPAGAADGALAVAVGHLVARCRAFLLELEATGQEIGGLGDPRAAALLEALAGTTIMPSPHSLRALEQQATELLLRLR